MSAHNQKWLHNLMWGENQKWPMCGQNGDITPAILEVAKMRIKSVLMI